jgi:hypothetical protein
MSLICLRFEKRLDVLVHDGNSSLALDYQARRTRIFYVCESVVNVAGWSLEVELVVDNNHLDLAVHQRTPPDKLLD